MSNVLIGDNRILISKAEKANYLTIYEKEVKQYVDKNPQGDEG